MIDALVHASERRVHKVPAHTKCTCTIIGDGTNIHRVDEDVVSYGTFILVATDVVQVTCMQTFAAADIIIAVHFVPAVKPVTLADADDVARFVTAVELITIPVLYCRFKDPVLNKLRCSIGDKTCDVIDG